MTLDIRRASPLFCLLAAMALQQAGGAQAGDATPAGKPAASPQAGSANVVGDCGVHDTRPLTASDGSVSYPDEHVFPAALLLQKGDNLGFLAYRVGDSPQNPGAPVNGWVYVYRPDGRLFACARNNTDGHLTLSIRGVPDSGTYQLRMVSHDSQPYEIKAVRWADVQATLTLGSPYLFSQFYPQQRAAFTLNVPKAGGSVVLAFDDKNKQANAFAEITAPRGQPYIVDLGYGGKRFQALQAGNYTIKVIPKPGTRLVGALEAVAE